MISYKINIFLRVLCDLFDLYRLLWACGYAFREFTGYAYAIITTGVQVRNKILEDYPKRAGDAAGLAACAAHLITLKMAVRGTLKRIMIAGVHAGGLFAMTADSSKGRVFPQIGNTVILRMVKITAGYPAFFAFVANI